MCNAKKLILHKIKKFEAKILSRLFGSVAKINANLSPSTSKVGLKMV